MHIREGIIPAVLGTAVTATGFALKNNIPKSYRNGIIGFGLAHIAMGSATFVGQKVQNSNMVRKASKAVSFK